MQEPDVLEAAKSRLVPRGKLVIPHIPPKTKPPMNAILEGNKVWGSSWCAEAHIKDYDFNKRFSSLGAMGDRMNLFIYNKHSPEDRPTEHCTRKSKCGSRNTKAGVKNDGADWMKENGMTMLFGFAALALMVYIFKTSNHPSPAPPLR